jgi:hypothetical protein
LYDGAVWIAPPKMPEDAGGSAGVGLDVHRFVAISFFSMGRSSARRKRRYQKPGEQ